MDLLPFSENKYSTSSFEIKVLMKVMKTEFVEDFLSGNLFMNSFDYIRKVEEKQTRGDDLEGVDSSYKSEDFILKISNGSGELIPIGGIINRGNFHSNQIINSNLFSMSAFSSNDLPKNELILNKEFQKLGDKTILITNAHEFILKIIKAFKKRKKISVIPSEPTYIRPVEYVSSQYNGRLGVFRKLDTYIWQKEMRIAFYRNIMKVEAKPYKFRIGSIRSICHVVDTSELINQGITII